MQNAFEEIREELHAIRNLLSPIDLKLDNLDHKITLTRISFETKTSELEAKIAAKSMKISEFALKLSENADYLTRHSDRIKRIELFLKMPEQIEAHEPTPVREDKLNPSVIPPQKPSV